ncbi:tyrosine/phenylalanine carboxypeptidase domain-containing protein [Flavivirga abyssicola]|uniref:flavohemoglobin expression-modulating QEGLA motif protein n=1 Tax=Flavivirga abyssicola TaxID=3063533 RepID=UPI0026DFA7FA|nr:tyrosine/phenylalanine carboxypeptidase domain-containing protein [Flavivirga sp. MEBiC07777]WVK13121.1 tyrosine/phenylalanine carboxypeptidase domain-containing protein [Flavivirga sp. MEBiC07777]
MKIDNDVSTQALLQIDKSIDSLVKQIELLSFVNPINIEEEKTRFFSSKYLTDPVFKYPNINFDKFKLHRELFTQSLELIEDSEIKNLYEDIIYEYSGLIQCIETIGSGKKFYYNSLRCFGTPTERDVENAKFILHFDDEDKNVSDFIPKYNASEAEPFFKAFSKKYDFSYTIKQSDKISAIAMVLNNNRTLVLNTNHTYSDNEIAVLTNHEIGVHMVTTMNGLSHPLKIFSHGFPNNEETQEGLAVFSEYMSDNLTITRLKELAYRVIAVDSLAKGYSFSKTFRLLHNQYDLDREVAFYITVRVHRGGGFTKDYLYLTGLKKIYNYYQEGKNLSLLLTGKVTLEYANEIEVLIKKGLAVPAKHITDSYAVNNNTNKKVDFILRSLK